MLIEVEANRARILVQVTDEIPPEERSLYIEKLGTLWDVVTDGTPADDVLKAICEKVEKHRENRRAQH